MVHAVSAFYERSGHMSPVAAGLAALLHGATALALFWVSPLSRSDLENNAIEVTFEEPKPTPPEPPPVQEALEPPQPAAPPPPPPAPAAEPAPPPSPPPAAAKPEPQPRAAARIPLGITPPAAPAPDPPKPEEAATREDPQPEPPKTEVARQEESKPEPPKAEVAKQEEPKPEPPQAEVAKQEQPKAEPPKPEVAKREEPKPEPPQAEVAKEEQARPASVEEAALAPPAKTPPPPEPPLETIVPPVESPPAPLSMRDFVKVMPPPPAPPPKPSPQPTARAQPAPNPPLQRSPLSTAPSSHPETSSGAAVSSFVNPAASAAQTRAKDAYLWQVIRKFSQYLPDLRQKGEGGTVVLRFVIARDGKLVDASVAQSSGVAALDRGLLESLRAASPYPPLPPEIPGNQAVFVQPIAARR